MTKRSAFDDKESLITIEDFRASAMKTPQLQDFEDFHKEEIVN